MGKSRRLKGVFFFFFFFLKRFLRGPLALLLKDESKTFSVENVESLQRGILVNCHLNVWSLSSKLIVYVLQTECVVPPSIEQES